MEQRTKYSFSGPSIEMYKPGISVQLWISMSLYLWRVRAASYCVVRSTSDIVVDLEPFRCDGHLAMDGYSSTWRQHRGGPIPTASGRTDGPWVGPCSGANRHLPHDQHSVQDSSPGVKNGKQTNYATVGRLCMQPRAHWIDQGSVSCRTYRISCLRASTYPAAPTSIRKNK